MNDHRKTKLGGGTFRTKRNKDLEDEVRRLRKNREENRHKLGLDDEVRVETIDPGIEKDTALAWTVDCRRCFVEAGGVWNVRMFLCLECGNKRCPKATDHRLACTGSNEPGQEGSAYQ